MKKVERRVSLRLRRIPFLDDLEAQQGQRIARRIGERREPRQPDVRRGDGAVIVSTS